MLIVVCVLLVIALVAGLAFSVFKNATKIIGVIVLVVGCYCVWTYYIKDRIPDSSVVSSSLSSGVESVSKSATSEGKKLAHSAKKKASDKGTQLLNNAIDSAIEKVSSLKK